MVNNEELIGTTVYLTLYTGCRINRCRYNRVRLYVVLQLCINNMYILYKYNMCVYIYINSNIHYIHNIFFVIFERSHK